MAETGTALLFVGLLMLTVLSGSRWWRSRISRSEEMIESGRVWRNVSLDESGFYEPSAYGEAPEEIGRRLSQIEAQLRFDEDLKNHSFGSKKSDHHALETLSLFVAMAGSALILLSYY